MRSSFLLASLRAVPLYCPPRMRGCPARVRVETKVVSTASCAPPHSGRPLAMTSIRLSSWVSTWSMLRSMILVLVVTLAPASLQFGLLLAPGGLLDCVKSLIGHKLHGGRQRGQERDGTGRSGWSGEVGVEEEQQSVEVGRVGRLLAAGDGCECSAGVRAGLGFEQDTAGWIDAFEEFLMATGVDGGGRLVLPSLPDVGSVVGVLWWCWWSGFREGYPFRWFPSMCCQ